ncbi:MAG: outer membrane protein assembly factor BamC [Bermanella sp.]
MRLVGLLVSLSLMSGCSWLFYDHDNDYLQSEIQENIKVPKRVASVEFKPQLPIPKAKKAELPPEFVLPRPRPLVALEEEEGTQLTEVQNQELEANLLKDGNGTPILRLNVAFARAWSAVGEALKVADIHMSDLNRSVGTYYIELEKEAAEVEQGFWSGLLGSEPEVEKIALQVKVNRARSGVYIAVHEDQDNLAEDEQAQDLLTRIKEHL